MTPGETLSETRFLRGYRIVSAISEVRDVQKL